MTSAGDNALPQRGALAPRWEAGWHLSRRVRRLADSGQRKVGQALDAIERAAATTAALRVAHVQPLAGAPRSARTWRGRLLRSIGVGLTTANAVAVVVMLVGPDRIDRPASPRDVGIAVLLGTLLGAGQLAFSLAVGRRLQEARIAATVGPNTRSRRPDHSIPFEAAALAMLGTLGGWVIYLWVGTRLGEEQTLLGDVLGIMLGLQAWIAPWLLVAETAAARPNTTGYIEMRIKFIRELATDRELDRSTAFLALVAARTALQEVERLAARVGEFSGRPIPASWALALRLLDGAIDEADARYAELIAGADDGGMPGPPGGSLGRDNVDLAG